MAFNPAGTRLAALVTVQDTRQRRTAGVVKVWDTTSGKEVLSLRGFPGGGGSLTFSPDGKSLAVGAEALETAEAAIQVHDAITGAYLLTLTGQRGVVRHLAFSPDGTRLASAGGDSRVRLWEVVHGQPNVHPPVRTLQGYTGAVTGVAFSADGQLLSAVGQDGVLKVWEVTVRDERVVVKYRGGHISATAANAVATRFAAAWQLSDEVELKVWDRAGKVVFVKMHSRPKNVRLIISRTLQLSPDGTRLALATSDLIEQAGKEKPAAEVIVWDITTGKELLHRASDTGLYQAHAFSPDGRRLLTTYQPMLGSLPGQTGRVSVWDLARDQELLGLDAPPLLSAAFSPDGRHILGGVSGLPSEGRACELRSWDATTGQGVRTRQWPHALVWSVAGDGAGTLFAAAVGQFAAPSEVKVVDAATGQERFTLKGHRGPVHHMVFSRDGRRLITAGWGPGDRSGEVKVWDMSTGRELLSLPTSPGPDSLAFSRDGHCLYRVGSASAGPDVEVQRWDATPLPEDKQVKEGNR
jgi:WD40 repeat protein